MKGVNGYGQFRQRRMSFGSTKEKKVKFVRLWFTDILGFLKSFAITINELEKALEEGMGFDGSSIQGFVRIDESDMVAMPDPDTFQILPWRSKIRLFGCPGILQHPLSRWKTV